MVERTVRNDKGVKKMRKRKRLEKFLEENLDSIYRFAYTYMRNRENAEDVVSDSVVKALKAVGNLKNEDSMKCWFYSIVANTALSPDFTNPLNCTQCDTSVRKIYITRYTPKVTNSLTFTVPSYFININTSIHTKSTTNV